MDICSYAQVLTCLGTVSLASVWLPSSSSASGLYTLNVNEAGNLLRVDPATGMTTPLNPERSLGAGSWNGLSPSPADPDILFAVNNPRPPTFEDPQFSRLARINLTDATATLFELFDVDVLGISQVFSTAVAISPLEPDVAVVAGFDRQGFSTAPSLWKVDLASGEALGPALPLQGSGNLESLTFGPDGTTLFAADSAGRLVTVESDTGAVQVVGDPELSNFITGLAFRLEDNTLFATEGLGEDRLIILDPTNGAFISEVGPLGIPGPEGLAFVGGRAVAGDCNGDGVIDVRDANCTPASDLAAFLSEQGLIAGDADGDGQVQFSDFVALSLNFGMAGQYTDGDFDKDGVVQFADFVILANNFSQAAGATAVVPEPAAGVLVVLCVVGLIGWWRR